MLCHVERVLDETLCIYRRDALCVAVAIIDLISGLDALEELQYSLMPRVMIAHKGSEHPWHHLSQALALHACAF